MKLEEVNTRTKEAVDPFPCLRGFKKFLLVYRIWPRKCAPASGGNEFSDFRLTTIVV